MDFMNNICGGLYEVYGNKTKNTKNKMKTLDIKALSWFDKINGNTYFSALVIINFGTSTERTFKIPYQYGYGETYLYEANNILRENNIIDNSIITSLWKYCKENDIILRHSINSAKKKELKELIK